MSDVFEPVGRLGAEPQAPALEGIVVADFSHILAGPFCTQFLADAGATVYKIEPPGGESSRRRGPRRFRDDGSTVSAYSSAVNRGKRSIALDLKTEAGLDIARRLIATADVLVENFAPATMTRLGLDLGELRQADPRLITCSISLFGSKRAAGDLADRGGMAIVAESESSVCGMYRDSHGVPVQGMMPLGDMAAGLMAYSAITTALVRRERTGVGGQVDLAMVKALLALNAGAIAAEDIVGGGDVMGQYSRTAPYGIFAAADGYVTIGVNNDSLFARFAAAIDEEWMAEDERYAGFAERDQRVDEVHEIVGKWMARHRVDDIIATVAPTGVPCGRVATPRDVLESEDLARLRYLDVIDDGLGGEVRVPANPLGYQSPRPAIPLVGEHTGEILAEALGLGPADVDSLRKAGAFGP